jgi:hypothetical protein
MAIPCASCGNPVHEQVVVCPHCAYDTGVPADPIAETEIATLPELPAPEPTEHLVDGNRRLVEPLGRAVATGVAKVVSAFDRVVDDDADHGPLPRAIAREKPRHDTNTKTTATHRRTSSKG